MNAAYSPLFLAKKDLLLDLSAGKYPSRSFQTVPRSLDGTPDQASSRSERRSTAAAEADGVELASEEREAEGGFRRASKRATRGSEAERVGGGGEASLCHRCCCRSCCCWREAGGAEAASRKSPLPLPLLRRPPATTAAVAAAAPAFAASPEEGVVAVVVVVARGATTEVTAARRARTEPGSPRRPERKLFFFFLLGEVEEKSVEREKVDSIFDAID